jgi:plasmid segregation protein ParM
MKAVAGNREIIFPNIVCYGEKRIDMDDLSANTTIEQLDVIIENQSGLKNRYYVGKMAIREGKHAQYIYEKDRVNSEYGKASFLTALALLTNDSHTKFIVGTGLPVADYRSALKKRYEDTLPGKYEITFPLENVTKTIEIVAARVFLQGMGVFFDQVLDDTLNEKSDHPLLSSGVYGIIDVGSRTTNFELFEDKRAVERVTDSIEHGITDVHQTLLKHAIAAGYTIQEGKDEILIKMDKLEQNGDIIDLRSIRERAIRSLVTQIQNKAEQLWTDFKLELNQVFVAGGAGQIVFDYLNFKNKVLVERPQFANAWGFLKAVSLAAKLGKVHDSHGRPVEISG